MSDIKAESRKATKWSLLAEIVGKLIALITNLILARILMPEAFGAVATITMVISFTEVFTDAGFQKYIVQHDFSSEDEYTKNVNVAFWSNLCFSCFATAVIWLLRDQIAVIVGAPELSLGIAIASGSIILVTLSSIQLATFKRKLDFKSIFIVRFIAAFVPILVTVPLAFILKNFWALVIGTLSVHVVQVILLTVRSSWHPRFEYSFSIFKQMFSFSFWSLLEAISIWLSSNVDIFLVGRRLNDYYLGLYKTSISTVNSYMSVITSAILPVAFATFSRLQSNQTEFVDYYYKIQRVTAIIVIPMGVGIYVYRDFVTEIILGGQWAEAADLVGLWGLMIALSIVLGYFASEVYRSKGKPRVSLVVQLVHIAFLIPAVIIGLNLGYDILALMRSLVRIEMIISHMLILHIMFGINAWKTLLNIYPQVLSAIVMGVAGYAMLQISDNLIWKIASVLICIVVYFAIVMIFPTVRKEILGFIRRKKSSEKINEVQ